MVLVPPGDATVTSTVPAVPGGEVAVIEVAEVTLKPAALVEPNFTVVAPPNPVPVIVTDVPPAAGPLLGATFVTVGLSMTCDGSTVNSVAYVVYGGVVRSASNKLVPVWHDAPPRTATKALPS